VDHFGYLPKLGLFRVQVGVYVVHGASCCFGHQQDNGWAEAFPMPFLEEMTSSIRQYWLIGFNELLTLFGANAVE
jgi:hypothetical protein